MMTEEKKILEELENLRKNYENARKEFEKSCDEKTMIEQKTSELTNICKEKDELKDKI